MPTYKLWALIVHLDKHTHEQISELDSSCWLSLKHAAVAMQTMPHGLNIQWLLCKNATQHKYSLYACMMHS